MAWGSLTTSAKLTTSSSWQFLKAGSDIARPSLNPRELMSGVFRLESVGTTDDLDVEIMGGHQLATGTSQSGGSTTTIKLAAGDAAADDDYIGCFVIITSGSEQGKIGLITDYVSSTKIATFTPAMAAAPDAMTYEIFKIGTVWAAQIDSTALALTQLHTIPFSIFGYRYVLFRAKATGATNAHKCDVAWQVDGVSA